MIGTALVLGSGQPDSDVDRARAARAGIDIVRRRSGGGAVLVAPGLVSWVDVFVPYGDPLWDDDVGRASWWLGQAWADALILAGAPGAEVWRGALQRSAWSSKVCFAGTGPGEVSLEGQKAVGISQRRTRRGALFQCALVESWDPAPVLDVLALAAEERAAAAGELAGIARGVGRDVADGTVSAFLAGLP